MMLRDGALTELFAGRFTGGRIGISEVAVSSDGRHAAAVSSGGELVLIDVATGSVRSHRAHAYVTRRVRFADNDQIVVTASDDGYLKAWRLDDLALTSEINVGHGQIYDLDVRGTLAVVATSDGNVSSWDLSTQRLVHTYRADGAQGATGRFDASGQWLVTGDYEGATCLHHVDQDGCYMALIGHKAAPAVRHGLFLDDGPIITASDDGTVRQWRPPYKASTAELACELQQYRFSHGPKAAPCKT